MIKQQYDELTVQEEVQLGVKIQEMKAIKEKLNAGNKLTKADMGALNEGEEAYEKLIGNYYNLARDIAHKHHRRTGTRYSLNDLFQDAFEALCQAALDYDPSKNCKLGTYAYYGIAKKVSTSINYQRLVRMPENKMYEYSYILRAQEAFAQLVDNNEMDESQELEYLYANVEGQSKEEIDLILINMQPQVSLNAAIDDDGSELMDLMEGSMPESDTTDLANLDNSILEVLKQLTQHEVDLISYEFEAIPSRIPYEQFLAENDLTDRKAKARAKKAIRRMNEIGQTMKNNQ